MAPDFTVTVGMTSLVDSSGEDFASILRSLGYPHGAAAETGRAGCHLRREAAVEATEAVQPSDNSETSEVTASEITVESVLNGENGRC